MIIRERKNICSEMHDEVVPAVQHFDIQECRRSVWCKRRELGQDRAGVGEGLGGSGGGFIGLGNKSDSRVRSERSQKKNTRLKS